MASNSHFLLRPRQTGLLLLFIAESWGQPPALLSLRGSVRWLLVSEAAEMLQALRAAAEPLAPRSGLGQPPAGKVPSHGRIAGEPAQSWERGMGRAAGGQALLPQCFWGPERGFQLTRCLGTAELRVQVLLVLGDDPPARQHQSRIAGANLTWKPLKGTARQPAEESCVFCAVLISSCSSAQQLLSEHLKVPWEARIAVSTRTLPVPSPVADDGALGGREQGKICQDLKREQRWVAQGALPLWEWGCGGAGSHGAEVREGREGCPPFSPCPGREVSPLVAHRGWEAGGPPAQGMLVMRTMPSGAAVSRRLDRARHLPRCPSLLRLPSVPARPAAAV